MEIRIIIRQNHVYNNVQNNFIYIKKNLNIIVMDVKDFVKHVCRNINVYLAFNLTYFIN